jgi:DNA-binding GntR family transcriptional regulator
LPNSDLADLVVRTLRDRVLDGELAPGARIGQEEIARELSVSRIPVRDALSRLAHEGLVTVVPRSGATVTRFDHAELVEIYRIREVLEPLAVGASARGLSGGQLAEVDRELASIESSQDDGAAWIEHDRRFHLACNAAAGMPRLTGFIESLRNLTHGYRVALRRLLSAQDAAEIYEEHRMLAAALHLRDAAVAEEVLRLHLRRTRVRLGELPELFAAGPARRRRRPRPGSGA